MAEVDFSDSDSAEAWFEKQSAETRSAMSCRAALRHLAHLFDLEGDLFGSVASSAFRALLSSAVRAYRPSDHPEWLTIATRSAATVALDYASSFNSSAKSLVTNPESEEVPIAEVNSTRFVVDSLIAAARSAVIAGGLNGMSKIAMSYESNSAHYVALSAAFAQDANDPNLLEGKTALWKEVSIPKKLEAKHIAFLEKLDAHPDWAFWRNWYLAMWNGTPIDWDFAIEVAKIPDDVWGAGFEAVGAEIRRRSEKYVVKKLPQIEEVFEDDDGLYDVRASITDASRLLESVLNRLEFALETALKSNMCDLNEMSLPARILRHVIENCAEDPNSIEQYFREASAQIKSKVKEGQFAEDDELSLLVNVLDETALQLRADHPEVAAASEARVGQKLKEISDDQRLEIADSIDALQEGSAPRLAAEFGLAAETARDDTAPEAVASAIKKSGERSAKISMLERAKQAEGSGGMSSLKMALRAKRVVEFVMGLLGGGVG